MQTLRKLQSTIAALGIGFMCMGFDAKNNIDILGLDSGYGPMSGYMKCDRPKGAGYVPPRRPYFPVPKFPDVDHDELPDIIGLSFSFCVGKDGFAHNFEFETFTRPPDWNGDLSPFKKEIIRVHSSDPHKPATMSGEPIEVCGCDYTFRFEIEGDENEED